jgi:hypothetical protein
MVVMSATILAYSFDFISLSMGWRMPSASFHISEGVKVWSKRL